MSSGGTINVYKCSDSIKTAQSWRFCLVTFVFCYFCVLLSFCSFTVLKLFPFNEQQEIASLLLDHGAEVEVRLWSETCKTPEANATVVDCQISLESWLFIARQGNRLHCERHGLLYLMNLQILQYVHVYCAHMRTRSSWRPKQGRSKKPPSHATPILKISCAQCWVSCGPLYSILLECCAFAFTTQLHVLRKHHVSMLVHGSSWRRLGLRILRDFEI